eukprot:1780330-Prymnesium_polylepis.1
MTTKGRNRDPTPSGTPAPFPHTMRGRPNRRSASAVPVLTVGAGGRNVYWCTSPVTAVTQRPC